MKISTQKAQGKAPSRKQKGQSKVKAPKIDKGKGKAQVISIKSNMTGYPSLKAKKSLSPYYKQVARQLVTPGSCGSDTVVVPSRGAPQLCSRHIHFVTDVRADNPGFDSGFTVAMFPDLTNPGYLTAGATLAEYPADAPSKMSASALVVTDTSNPSKITSSTTTLESGELPKVKCQMQSKIVGGVTYYGYFGTFSGVLGVEAMNKSANSGSLTIVVSAIDEDDIVTKICEIDSLAQGKSASATGDMLDSDWVVIQITGVSKVSAVDLNFRFANAQVNVNDATALVPQIPEFILDKEVTEGRVVSMSILATNTSPELSSGGNINVARVPADFDAWNAVPANIAKLPENRRYASTAKFGGYAFWVPRDLDEYESNDLATKISQYSGSNYLILNVNGWQSSSTFKIQFDWVVEFYTPSQLYEKIEAPPFSNDMQRLLTAANSINAACCNPEHESKFQEMVRFVADKGRAAYNTGKALIDHIDKYGPMYAEIAAALAEML